MKAQCPPTPCRVDDLYTLEENRCQINKVGVFKNWNLSFVQLQETHKICIRMLGIIETAHGLNTWFKHS